VLSVKLSCDMCLLFKPEKDTDIEYKERYPPSTALCWSQWTRDLRRGSEAAHLVRLWVRIPPGHGCLSVVIVVYCQVEISAKG
jgi:hypothetical protein